MRKSILLAGFLTLPSISRVFTNKLTPELLWKLGRVGDAVLSPDAKTILFTQSEILICRETTAIRICALLLLRVVSLSLLLAVLTTNHHWHGVQTAKNFP